MIFRPLACARPAHAHGGAHARWSRNPAKPLGGHGKAEGRFGYHPTEKPAGAVLRCRKPGAAGSKGEPYHLLRPSIASAMACCAKGFGG